MNKKENYLERKPIRCENIVWTQKDGNVTLEIENKGIVNRIFQLLFKKPNISYVHLDGIGNFLWPLLDGKQNISSLGEAVKEEFGQEAEPLYERLITFLKILESYGFIKWN